MLSIVTDKSFTHHHLLCEQHYRYDMVMGFCFGVEGMVKKLRCSGCGKLLPVTSFHKANKDKRGYNYYCLICKAAVAKKYRKANREVKREYYKNNRDKILESLKKYKQNNPLKVKAREVLHNAIENNRVIKPKRCSRCNKKFNPHGICGHHEDYSKPLDVLWVCHQCHSAIHRKL